MNAPADADDWTFDHVILSDGKVLPVRATARRPTWDSLPSEVRAEVESAAGSRVVSAWSAGTGFTPGFASRLELVAGQSVFVKAASSADDTLHGWALSDAYREEARKLALLPADIGSPPLLWTRSLDVAGDSWIVLGFEYVDAQPPRRPWQPDQLKLVLDRFTSLAPSLAQGPPELELEDIADHLIGHLDHRLDRIRANDGDSSWLRTVEELCRQAPDYLRGASVVHMDLRDDNVLIGRDGSVWFVDWNWPVLGAAWIDPICMLLSARGDGLDVEPLIAEHPLTRDVEPAAIDCLLAVLLSFWAIVKTDEVPAGSPHLRDHQSWYAEVTQGWLEERLTASRVSRPAASAPSRSRGAEST